MRQRAGHPLQAPARGPGRSSDGRRPARTRRGRRRRRPAAGRAARPRSTPCVGQPRRQVLLAVGQRERVGVGGAPGRSPAAASSSAANWAARDLARAASRRERVEQRRRCVACRASTARVAAAAGLLISWASPAASVPSVTRASRCRAVDSMRARGRGRGRSIRWTAEREPRRRPVAAAPRPAPGTPGPARRPGRWPGRPRARPRPGSRRPSGPGTSIVATTVSSRPMRRTRSIAPVDEHPPEVGGLALVGTARRPARSARPRRPPRQLGRAGRRSARRRAAGPQVRRRCIRSSPGSGARGRPTSRPRRRRTRPASSSRAARRRRRTRPGTLVSSANGGRGQRPAAVRPAAAAPGR